jgi:hypothetical protein
MDKKSLSERDICTKFISPAIEKAGWNKLIQIREEVTFTDGKIYVRGKLTAREAQKHANYILYYNPNIPIAIIEAKDNKHSVRAGMQQALNYGRILHIPCVFSSNGDGFLFHDRTATGENLKTELENIHSDIQNIDNSFTKFEEYQCKTIGQLCDVIKGNTGIKTAIDGVYPLVTTAEERGFHKSFQFDAEAVCIPLVSSSGHGHASLKEYTINLENLR